MPNIIIHLCQSYERLDLSVASLEWPCPLATSRLPGFSYSRSNINSPQILIWWRFCMNPNLVIYSDAGNVWTTPWRKSFELLWFESFVEILIYWLYWLKNTFKKYLIRFLLQTMCLEARFLWGNGWVDYYPRNEYLDTMWEGFRVKVKQIFPEIDNQKYENTIIKNFQDKKQ